MTAKSRRLPQFSLITLIVAVNVAGVLLWANVRIQITERQVASEVLFVYESHGWPLVHSKVQHFFYLPPGTTRKETRAPYSQQLDDSERTFRFVLDMVIALVLVALSAVLTEFLVRRFRKAKRRDG